VSGACCCCAFCGVVSYKLGGSRVGEVSDVLTSDSVDVHCPCVFTCAQKALSRGHCVTDGCLMAVTLMQLLGFHTPDHRRRSGRSGELCSCRVSCGPFAWMHWSSRRTCTAGRRGQCLTASAAHDVSFAALLLISTPSGAQLPHPSLSVDVWLPRQIRGSHLLEPVASGRCHHCSEPPSGVLRAGSAAAAVAGLLAGRALVGSQGHRPSQCPAAMAVLLGGHRCGCHADRWP
jgi:hypothetical protein